MANVLGSLFINLKANVADYVSGMGAAAYASKQAGKDIRESFEGLGGILGTALAPLGELGQVISETFEKVGSFAGDATTKIGKVGGAIGLIGAGAGAAVGALAAVEAGAIGLALHGAEVAAQMDDLSKKTGVSTEALSGLGYAAKQSGVDQETLTKGLEKLNKSVFAAATAPSSMQNAFTRLGIQVKDTTGNIRSTEEIFGDVAEKIAGVENPVARGALAMQIFGKSGAELLPLLLEGKEGIDELLDSAKKLGVVIDSTTAAAAHRFSDSLDDIKAAGEGATLQISQALLPAMQAVASAITDAIKTKGGGFDDIVAGVKTITQYFISFGGLVTLIFRDLEISLGAWGAKAVNEVQNVVAQVKNLGKLDFSAVKAQYQDYTARTTAIEKQGLADKAAAWEAYKNLLTNAFKDSPDSVAKKSTKKTDVDLAKEEVDKHLEAIKAQIAALNQAADAEAKLAATTVDTAAALRIQTADNEAGALITKLYSEADKETGKEKTKLIALIRNETAAIIANERAKTVAADAVKLNQSLAEQSQGFIANIEGLQRLVAAYQEGGDAIADAEIEKQLDASRLKVATLAEELQTLSQTSGVSGDKIISVTLALQNASYELDKQNDLLRQRRALELDLTIAKESDAFKEQLPALEALSDAYLVSAEAVRRAQIELQVSKFRSANPGATDDQVAKQRALYQAQSDQARAAQVQQEAAAYSLTLQYTNQIAKLEDVRAALVDVGDSTLLVDAQIFDENDKIIEQYDAAALKVGDFGAKTRAVLNQIYLDGKNLGENVFKSFGTAIEGLEDQLTNLAVTGKANFRELLQTFDKNIVSAGVKKIFSSAASSLNNSLFGGAIPGLGGAKADGSTASPYYVIPVDTSGNVLGSVIGGLGKAGGGFSAAEDKFLDTGVTPGGSGGISDALSGLTTKMSSIFSSLVGSLGSVLGGLGSTIGGVFRGIFGGFLANGGDASPGKAYIVGEKHPEFFSPKVPGSVSPKLHVSGGSQTIAINNHFYGVTDHDSFKRSEAQIGAFFAGSVTRAQARTR
jgi:hypothetical protein